MKLYGGEPFWLIQSGLLTIAPPLERDERCEVAVIGAGITGALVAYELAKSGLDVVVVDRRDLATGSAPRCCSTNSTSL